MRSTCVFPSNMTHRHWSLQAFSIFFAKGRLERRQNLLGMPLGFDFRKNLRDAAVFSDDERGALDAHDLLAVHVLLFVNTVSLGRGFIDVAEQGERQIELLLEF